jgi:hypothetical protein
MAEKPIIVSAEQAINSLADNRQGRPAMPLPCLNRVLSRHILDAPESLLRA